MRFTRIKYFANLLDSFTGIGHICLNMSKIVNLKAPAIEAAWRSTERGRKTEITISFRGRNNREMGG